MTPLTPTTPMFGRRLFLALPFLAATRSLALDRALPQHRFAYDGILGTSMDLIVWTRDPAAATRVEQAVLDEIDRLTLVLDTRDPRSEIRRFEAAVAGRPSPDLERMFELYRQWEQETEGIVSLHPLGPHTPANVDALGKAYIIDRAVAAGRAAERAVDGILLDIGGDIVVYGQPCVIAVADPRHSEDNGQALTHILLQDAAVATSGTSARGNHLLDARTGLPPAETHTATVIARDAVAANALAAVSCVTGAEEGMAAVERSGNAAALRILSGGAVQRSAGFHLFERPPAIRPVAFQASRWPAGYDVRMSIILTSPGPRALRPYLAAWVEDGAGRLVKILVLWGTKAEWMRELPSFWAATDRGDEALIFPVTRPTRNPGRYQFTWDGTDSEGRPVAMGSYRIVVESNRERGEYTRGVGTIVCGDAPASLTLAATANLDTVTVTYGPRPSTA